MSKEVEKFAISATTIEDPILEPYFIVNNGPNDFTVNKKRFDNGGIVRYSAVKYPSTFYGCLTVIAKCKMAEGLRCESIQEYLDRWTEISEKLYETYKTRNI